MKSAPTGDKARVLALLTRRRRRLSKLCARLVQIPSENPPGDTTRIAAFVERYLRTHGFAPTIYEPKREVEVLENVTQHNTGPMAQEAARRIFERIIDEMRTLQRLRMEAPRDLEKSGD